MVKNLGVPFVTAGEDDVGKITEFFLCVRLHLEVRETIDDVKWDDITIIGGDALTSTNTHRAVINLVAVGFDLTGRMYRAVQAMVSTLSKDKDNGTTVGDGPGRSVNELKSVEFVIVDAGDVNLAGVDMENFGVAAKNATIGATIHEGTSGASCMCANGVGDDGGVIRG